MVEVIQFIQDKGLDELNIVLLGDLIDGCLRMSNLQTMDSTVAKSVADVSDMIIAFLETLVERTHVHINLFDVVYSNHSMPRFLQNYDIREDLGYTINRYIRTGLRNNKNIDVYSPLDGDICLDFKIWDFNMIGFHGHNNLQMGLANTIKAIEVGVDSVDATILGMGRGAGNLNTELIARYYNQLLGEKYDIDLIISLISKYIMPIFHTKKWGYSPYLFLTGMKHYHPNYACYLLDEIPVPLEKL